MPTPERNIYVLLLATAIAAYIAFIACLDAAPVHKFIWIVCLCSWVWIYATFDYDKQKEQEHIEKLKELQEKFEGGGE